MYDHLVNTELLTHANANANADAELIYCGKEPGRHGLIQDEIHRILVVQANLGNQVLRLKGGAPFVRRCAAII